MVIQVIDQLFHQFPGLFTQAPDAPKSIRLGVCQQRIVQKTTGFIPIILSSARFFEYPQK
jgi:hypothetical protein